MENRLLEQLEKHFVETREFHDFAVVPLHHLFDAESGERLPELAP